MSGVQITIDGLDEWRTMVDPDRFEREMDKAVQRAAEMLRDETKLLPPVSGPRDGYDALGIPVDTGRLRQSIAKRRIGLMAAEIYTGVDYAAYVYDGTRGVPPRPWFSWLWNEFQGEQATDAILQAAIDKILTP
jgi:hypothetical protein